MTAAIVWSLCASDSRCGAGMQALLAQAALNNVECRTIITALTAQSHLGVAAVESVAWSMLEAQWQAAVDDGQPDAVLIGWLPPNPELIRWVKKKVMGLECPIIWDPVIKATDVSDKNITELESADLGSKDLGSKDLESRLQKGFDAAINTIRELIPVVTVMTPSLAEARWLAMDDTLEALEAGRQLQKQGAHTVMVSGGDSYTNTPWITDIIVSQPHSNQPETCVLPEFALHQQVLFQNKIRKHAHGTGSQLAAAIAVHIARGERLYDALLMGALAARESLKNGDESYYGNTLAAPLPNDGDEWPLITAVDEQPIENSEPVSEFPRVSALGLYALTDNLAHLDNLVKLKVDTIQWRVKEKNTKYQDNAAIALQRCRDAGIPFWLNDDWQLALTLKPDGVHLGQEDMSTADLNALRTAGIAIGISTHTQWEIARARAINPSYIAFGPVYPPLSKRLKYPPLGCAQLRQWHQRYSSWPHTCIGGILPSNAKEVAATGIDSFAVVTGLLPGPEQENNAIALHQALKTTAVSPN